ncbi:MAG: DUF5681 domain-containing protein [Pseudomonadota bacterium]
MSKRRPPGDSTVSDYEVGYKRPPAETQFKPGVSGNPSGKAKKLKPRSIKRDVQDVFTRRIGVREGKRTREVPVIVALIQKAVIDAMNGDKRATQFCYRVAEAFGVFQLKDDLQIDLEKLTPEEREICMKGAQILNKAGMLFRYDR